MLGKGIVAGALVLGVAWQQGAFTPYNCDMDGDGQVYRQLNDTELSRTGQLGYGVSISDDGTEFYMGDEICKQKDLVTAGGAPLAGYKMANRM